MVCVGRTWIWILDLNSGEILRELGKFLGKYRTLDGRSMGSKGLKNCFMRKGASLIYIKQCISPMAYEGHRWPPMATDFLIDGRKSFGVNDHRFSM